MKKFQKNEELNWIDSNPNSKIKIKIKPTQSAHVLGTWPPPIARSSLFSSALKTQENPNPHFHFLSPHQPKTPENRPSLSVHLSSSSSSHLSLFTLDLALNHAQHHTTIYVILAHHHDSHNITISTIHSHHESNGRKEVKAGYKSGVATQRGEARYQFRF